MITYKVMVKNADGDIIESDFVNHRDLQGFLYWMVPCRYNLHLGYVHFDLVPQISEDNPDDGDNFCAMAETYKALREELKKEINSGDNFCLECEDCGACERRETT